MIYILSWQYSNKSTYKIIRAYTDKTMAESDLKLFSEVESGRDWNLTELEEIKIKM